ncbi:MAG: phosphomannomutase/phosphoglucomutase [Deltaproteobacteria bacterium]|nr:phosphomannomutase/phosphoglucomutase [Deltaproteobacteria bacterium]MCW5805856.1 phosphomannomutase/phosphoglucomutase [Deltaproteobacteria bacterium]
MNPRVFREYDIRGVAERDLDDDTVRAIGNAIGARAGNGPVVVGRDCRTSSPRLFAALTDGIRVHAPVLDIGVVPSPVLYFAAHHLAPTAAVMVTGSHNPPEDNGLKLMRGTETLYGAAIAELRDDVARIIAEPAPHPTKPMSSRDVIGAYVERAMGELRLGTRRCKVVVDAGNGAGGPTAASLYKRLGFEVVPLYCDLDGTFPNHHPDPTQPANLVDLIAMVKSSRAEIGIALDGDGDRVGVVDGTGRVLWGDQLMILLGKALLEDQPGAGFVGEVKCSQTMYDALTAAGGAVEMWKVGHSLIKARMKETGALLAGEMSGHLFFAHRWLGFDDGIYAGARVLELLSRGARKLADHASDLPATTATPELRIDCPDEHKFAVVAAATDRLRADPAVRSLVDIDGVRARFDGGWGLVRASNTQPALVLRVEADTPARLDEIRALVEAHVHEARAVLGA